LSGVLSAGGYVTIIASAVGGLLFLLASHAQQPKHPEAAYERDVSELAVKLERVAADVDHNTSVLQDVRTDLSTIRSEQTASKREILSAIKAATER